MRICLRSMGILHEYGIHARFLVKWVALWYNKSGEFGPKVWGEGMIWIILGALVLLYCAVVNIRLGKVRFSVVPAAGGLGMVLLGVLILFFPEQSWVWVLQLAVTVGVFVLAAVECIVLAGCYKEDKAETPPDYTIVLGCGLKKGNQMTSTLLERLSLARELHGGEPMVLSGGQTPRETVPEADVMINWMKRNGVPDRLLLGERGSLNTRQNLENSKALLEEKEGTEIGNLYIRIITSNFHAGRVRRLAIECGYQNTVVCGSKTVLLLAPMYHLRECLAILYGQLKTRDADAEKERNTHGNRE